MDKIEKTALFKWYIISLVMVMFGWALFLLGYFGTVWEADLTKLSFLILGMFFVTTLKSGHDIYLLEYLGIKEPRKIEFGWFISEVYLNIGMVGTIIGFIFIMKDFSMVNFEDVSTVQDLIVNLGAGVSTALYTTLFGLVASTITKVQYFIFEESYKERESDNEQV